MRTLITESLDTYSGETSYKVEHSLKASVVIPTFYRSHDLSCLLESLLEQLAKPMEILVIDDTPTNGIRRVCEKYMVNFRRVGVTLVHVKSDRKRSISIARNLGAKMAHGEIVMFLDSDVILIPDYIEKVLELFKKHPRVLGIGSWRTFKRQVPGGIRYHSLQTLRKIFLLNHNSRDSCKSTEYPIVLSRTIYCHWLMGETMSIRKAVFDEFQFDENLTGYSFGEDYLFSHSIYKKYPNSLLITPIAIAIHNFSGQARPKGKELADIVSRNRKYIPTKLWGSKGLLMFGWQNLGLLILRVRARIRKATLGLAEEIDL